MNTRSKNINKKGNSDTNNNAKSQLSKGKKTKASPKKSNRESNAVKTFVNKLPSPPSPRKKINTRSNNSKKIIVNNSIKILGSNKNNLENDKQDKNIDVYEFIFDPNEEPQPQKKKRKKSTVKKQPKATKPKAVFQFQSNYDQNISKALSALKKAIKPSKVANMPQIKEINDLQENVVAKNTVLNISAISKENLNNTDKTPAQCHNYPSIRIEDIAANIEPSIEEHHDDLNYSPVNSPLNPVHQPIEQRERSASDKDPLNLQDNLSFFDDIPIANSSMNTSVRHPLASPWRVEFGSLPIKWHSNTYVKPNMTPAVECSFICSEDSSKKKHVYTNIVPEADDPLPPISSTPKQTQPSIISFIKEVAERQAQKKRGRSVSPSKAIAGLDNIHTNICIASNPIEEVAHNKHHIASNKTSEKVSNNNDAHSNLKDMCKENKKSRKRKNSENTCSRSTKSPRKQKNKDCTYFGFDDSENQDQENRTPIKVNDNHTGRSLRTRFRPVLQEINGPTRATKPMAAKSKTATSLEALNKVYLDMKSASDAPVFAEKNVGDNITHIEDPEINEDSESVHLFEDIELIHHLKPICKSYSKPKKVIFRPTSSSDEETPENDSSYDNDFGDLTFEVPNVKENKKTKKKKPKTLMTKKEKKEAEEWAAGFNSMCQEIEEFPLVVE